MPSETTIEVTGKVLLNLPDGTSMRVQPGPYGKGISFVPVLPKGVRKPSTPTAPGSGKRGRKPRPSTVALRELLAKHVRSGDLWSAKKYTDWVLDRDESISLAVARQVVYRERRLAEMDLE